MHPVFNHNLFLVKEHYGFFKAANNYDILDPATGEVLLTCREPRLGPISKLLRFTDYKRMTPFFIDIDTPSGEQVLSVRRGISLFLSKVSVHDENDQVIGGFKQKLFSIGGAFDVLDANDRILCSLKGKWTGWDFRFMAGNEELARVTKKWRGIGAELFTNADTYMLEIDEDVPHASVVRQLIFGAVMCIDMVLKE
jgi:uncharacterized protein YxjI